MRPDHRRPGGSGPGAGLAELLAATALGIPAPLRRLSERPKQSRHALIGADIRFYRSGKHGSGMGSVMEGGVDQVRFVVTMRPADDGRADVLVKLYRDGQMVSETVVSTLKETKARMILLMSRMQLFRLGYQEHVPVMPRVTEFPLGAV